MEYRNRNHVQKHRLIINGLAQVPFDGKLIEAYNSTTRTHNKKFGIAIQVTSMDSRFA